MNDTWKNSVREAIKKVGLTKEELCERLNMCEADIDKLIEGTYRVSLEELCRINEVLQIDLTEALYLTDTDNDLLLNDELQVRMNEIARSIPKHNRPYFLRALIYLAQCFED